jgi:hypothetical protein
MEKCPNCNSDKLIKADTYAKSSYEGGDVQTTFIINNINYSDINYETANDIYKPYKDKFLKIYQDFICIECRLVSKFINQDIIDKLKSDSKESEIFEEYYNISITKLTEFIKPYINSMNNLYEPIDLMLDQALNENLSFIEVNNKRDALKKYAKEFENRNSEFFKKIEEIYKSFHNEYEFISNLKKEFDKTFKNANFKGEYYKKNSDLYNIFRMTEESFGLFANKRKK